MTKKDLLEIALGSITLVGLVTLVSCNSNRFDNNANLNTKIDPTTTINPITKIDPTKTTNPTKKIDPTSMKNEKTNQNDQNILDGLARSITNQELRYDKNIGLYLTGFAYPNSPINPKRIKINEIKDKKNATIHYLFQKFDAVTKELSLTAKLILNDNIINRNFKVKYLDFETIEKFFQDSESNSHWFSDVKHLLTSEKIGKKVQGDQVGIPTLALPTGFSVEYFLTKRDVTNRLYKEFEYKAIVKHDSYSLTSSKLFKTKYWNYQPITNLLTDKIFSSAKSIDQIKTVLGITTGNTNIDLSKIDYDTSMIDQDNLIVNYKFKEFQTVDVMPSRKTNYKILKLIAEIKHGNLVKNHQFEIKFFDFSAAEVLIKNKIARKKTITQIEPAINGWTINSLIAIDDIKTKMGIGNFAVDESIFELPPEFEITKYKLLKTPFPLNPTQDNIDRQKVTFEVTIVHKESKLEITKEFSVEYADFRAIMPKYSQTDTYWLVDQLYPDFSKGIIASKTQIQDVEEDFIKMNLKSRYIFQKLKINEDSFPKLTDNLKKNFEVELQLNKKYEKVIGAEQSIELKIILTHRYTGIKRNKIITIKYPDLRPVLNDIFKDQQPSKQKLSAEQKLGGTTYKNQPNDVMSWIYENKVKTDKTMMLWKDIVKRFKLEDADKSGYKIWARVQSSKVIDYKNGKSGFEIEMFGLVYHKKSQITKTKIFKISYTPK